MTFEAEFLELMPSTLGYKPYASESGWGAASFGTTVNLRAHVTYTDKIVRGNTEEEANSSVQFECPPPGYVVGGVATPTITNKDQIVLPDTTVREVLSVVVVDDETGHHHQEVALT